MRTVSLRFTLLAFLLATCAPPEFTTSTTARALVAPSDGSCLRRPHSVLSDGSITTCAGGSLACMPFNECENYYGITSSAIEVRYPNGQPTFQDSRCSVEVAVFEPKTELKFPLVSPIDGKTLVKVLHPYKGVWVTLSGKVTRRVYWYEKYSDGSCYSAGFVPGNSYLVEFSPTPAPMLLTVADTRY